MRRATPAPWSVHGDDRTLIAADDGRQMLAECLHSHVVIEWARKLPEAQANAELIVQAVNERAALLELLRDFLAYTDADDEARELRRRAEALGVEP